MSLLEAEDAVDLAQLLRRILPTTAARSAILSVRLRGWSASNDCWRLHNGQFSNDSTSFLVIEAGGKISLHDELDSLSVTPAHFFEVQLCLDEAVTEAA